MRIIVGLSLLVLCFASAAIGCQKAASEKVVITKDAPAKKVSRVDVVFVLDTTGSMGGLIHAAKEKIWSIANSMATAKPAPQIRIGLVGYRDRGDAYVTKRVELTEDLDAVYSELMAFKANGGGDEPESVNQGLNEAVTKMKWQKGKNTYRVVFLVGDCAPHMNYSNDVLYPEVCKTAAAKGIYVNTIQCGNNAKTVKYWKDIAVKGKGNYFKVDQNGSAILASTPFDNELATLAKKLDDTRVYYGSKAEKRKQGKRNKVAKAINAKSSPSALAQRAGYNASKAGEKNLLGSKELVEEVAEGDVDIKDIAKDELPIVMQEMKPEERKEYVEQQSQKRKEIKTQIQSLIKERQKYIKEKIVKKGKKGKSLEDGIYKSVKSQAAQEGIIYESGPNY